MLPISQKETILKCVVIAVDLVFLAIELLILNSTVTFSLMGIFEQEITTLIFYCSYLLVVSFLPPVAHSREVRSEQIASLAFKTALLMEIAFYLTTSYIGGVKPNWDFLLESFAMNFLFLLASRLLCRQVLKILRKVGRDNRNVVLVGISSNVVELFKGMESDPTTGYRLWGYFYDAPSDNFENQLPYLGKLEDMEKYFDNHQIDQLYCALPSERATEIRLLMSYCENHLIRFYSVPNIRNYVHRQMKLEFVNDVPVLSIREEPLREPLNRFIKRTFDVVVSLCFLCTLFIPILIIVGIIIKVSSPGPIFFRQKRNGYFGKEFYCLKFRSMHVNSEADEVQATENDPRKFKFGDFMRRTNIDELPQFLNVLKGDMSVVGPRPHMLRHTEEYGNLIDRYMVRHFAKPGITGWAQVNGARGETKELWQMEDRVKKDIWYVENWTFWLDVRIIYLTIKNMLLHSDEQAY